MKIPKLKLYKEEESSLPFVPPDLHYLSESYVVKLPISDPHIDDPWQLRVHVEKILEERLGDEVQLTSMKVRKPHLPAKTKARLLKQEPCARAYVVVKF